MDRREFLTVAGTLAAVTASGASAKAPETNPTRRYDRKPGTSA